MTHHQHERPLQDLRAAVAVGPCSRTSRRSTPYYRLREAGAAVRFVGAEAGQTVTGKKGHELEIERAASDVRPPTSICS